MCRRQLNKSKGEQELLGILLITLDYIGLEMFRSHGQEVSHYLNQIVSIPFEFNNFICTSVKQLAITAEFLMQNLSYFLKLSVAKLAIKLAKRREQLPKRSRAACANHKFNGWLLVRRATAQSPVPEIAGSH